MGDQSQVTTGVIEAPKDKLDMILSELREIVILLRENRHEEKPQVQAPKKPSSPAENVTFFGQMQTKESKGAE